MYNKLASLFGKYNHLNNKAAWGSLAFFGEFIFSALSEPLFLNSSVMNATKIRSQLV